MGARNNNGKKTRPETIESQKRKAEALELRKMGFTFEQIAEQVGYNSKQAAYEAVRTAIREIIEEPAKDVLRLDLERLDALWLGAYANAANGDPQAIAACMRIMERRARLLGLDAPVRTDNKTEVSSKEGVLVVPPVMSPDEWARMAKEQQESLQSDD